MSKPRKNPAKSRKKSPKAQRKLRQLKDVDLSRVTGGGGADPCNNVMRQ